MNNKTLPAKGFKLLKEAGIALSLDALLFILVFGFASMKMTEYIAKVKEDDIVKATGEHINIANNAIRRVISDFHESPADLATLPGFAGMDVDGATVVFNGLDFLKKSESGCSLGVIPDGPIGIVRTPLEGYLGCTFPETTPMAQTYTVTFVNTPDGLRAQTAVSRVENPNNPARAGLLAEKIVGKAVSVTSNLSNVYWSMEANPGISMETPDITSPDFGAIRLLVTTSGNVDQWLNLDGSSRMRGDLEMEGFDINNVSTITGENDQLEVTADTYFSGANGVYVENGLSAVSLISRGDLIVEGETFLDDSLYVQGQARVSGSIDSGANITAVDFNVRGTTLNGAEARVSNSVFYQAIVNTGGAAVTIMKPSCLAGGAPVIIATPASTVVSNTSGGQYYGSYVQTTNHTTYWTVRAMEFIDSNFDGVPENLAKGGSSAIVSVSVKCQ